MDADAMMVNERLADYDWEEAFKYAETPEGVIGDATDRAAFTREDVVEVLGLRPGENDGPEWLGLFRLKDGRFAFLSAGCDYTGWG